MVQFQKCIKLPKAVVERLRDESGSSERERDQLRLRDGIRARESERAFDDALLLA